MDHPFRFGIEEELFLADAITREEPVQSLADFHADVDRQHTEVEREMLQSQIEIASPPSTNFDNGIPTKRATGPSPRKCRWSLAATKFVECTCTSKSRIQAAASI